VNAFCKTTIEWVSDGRAFAFNIFNERGELRAPDGEIVALSLEDWDAFYTAVNSPPLKKTAKKIDPAAPNAGRPWFEAQDRELASLWRSGSALAELARRFGRTKGGIVGRLLHLGLVDMRDNANAATFAIRTRD
jgi:hypothetical protein